MIINSALNVKAEVAAFNQEKALVGAFSVITNLRMELFEALALNQTEKWSLPGTVPPPLQLSGEGPVSLQQAAASPHLVLDHLEPILLSLFLHSAASM